MNAIVQHRLGVATAAAALLLLVGIATAARLADRRPAHGGDTRTIIRSVEQALGHWQTDNEAVCPPSLATLSEEHYLAIPARDAWGHPLTYACPGTHVDWGADVSSAGPDGVYGTADDIHSWER